MKRSWFSEEQIVSMLKQQMLGNEAKDNCKCYEIHEPEVHCISKAKARVRYQFEIKVPVVTTHK